MTLAATAVLASPRGARAVELVKYLGIAVDPFWPTSTLTAFFTALFLRCGTVCAALNGFQ